MIYQRGRDDSLFNNGRKTIGVLISQVNSDFQDVLSIGIMTRAKELNYNVAFFTNFGGYGQNNYDKGEIRIADLPCYEDFDGFIIVPETYAIRGLEDRIRDHISKRCTCPIVSVRRKSEDYYSVLVDDYSVIEGIVRHFIENHGFTRLNFLAGPKGYPDSDKRLEAYIKILKEYDIPIEEDRIYYGDFWKNEAYRAVDYWLASDLPVPQAIICANDYMAITTGNALHKKGYLVPGDIAVSGCDDVLDAAEYHPALTTARMPIHAMGAEAVDKIHKHLMGIEQEKASYMKTITVIRESCGCKWDSTNERIERKRYYMNLSDSLLRAIARNAYMSGDLTGLTKLEDINDRLRYYVYENVGFTDFYMCLRPDWQNYDEDEKEEEESFGGYNTIDNNEMMMEIGIKNRVDYSRINFPARELIPSEFVDDEPMFYFFSMLHHQSKSFGYAAISFDVIKTYMPTYQAWLINVSNALENISIHNELNRLVYKLEDMYIRDELTGLYNRRGMEILGRKYMKQAVEERSRMMVFVADMDKLKMINDNYGHVSGDIAIKAVADALSQAAEDDEICIRGGGDEFTVMGLEYDENKMSNFVRKFVDGLDKFNQSGENEFNVYVSYGWRLILPDENTTIEDCMIAADSRMYQQKYEKESLRLRANLVR